MNWAIFGNLEDDCFDLTPYVPAKTTCLLFIEDETTGKLAAAFASKHMLKKEAYSFIKIGTKRAKQIKAYQQLVNDADNVLILCHNMSMPLREMLRYAKSLKKPVQLVKLPPCL